MKYQHPLFLGTLFFTIQLSLILFFCPEKTVFDAWISLASHWDSEWYEAIAQYGYINIDGPIHTGLRNANVVFFPGYPYLARILILLLEIQPKIALLIISQTAALLFWCLFFYILSSTSCRDRLLAGMLVLLFPTSWFLFMGYSESVFIFTCCLMLWSATKKKWVLSGLSGFLMTATRLIGIPVLAAPIFTSIFFQKNIKSYLRPSLVALFSSLGCLGFLIYCAIAFGSWHLYFDMERIGWHGTADPFFLFKLPTWLPPPWGYSADFAPPLPNQHAQWFIFKFYRLAAYTFSETLVPLFLWIFIAYSLWILKKRKEMEEISLTWFIGALLLFLFSCFSLSTRYYESMSRCLFPVWILLIISEMIHPQKLGLLRGNKVILTILLLLYLIISGGFWLQLLDRYCLNWWVA